VSGFNGALFRGQRVLKGDCIHCLKSCG